MIGTASVNCAIR